MIELTIDGAPVAVPAGTTILQAARTLDVRIPTLCNLDGHAPYTSCMICVVWDEASGAMIPSCSARVVPGMVIRTDTEAVRDMRRAVLDLLLSEHVGDCEAPCRRACPAYMDIPAMIRSIQAGQMDRAAAMVKEHIPLPAVLGRICTAPCEKACRRAAIDDAVAVCLLKRFVGETDLQSENPYCPRCAPDTGYRVAIVGAGPAGLSAAWFARRAGHECVLYEKQSQAGGTLRSKVPRTILPEAILDREIEQISRLGITWQTGTELGVDVSLAELRASHDAVILALGGGTEELCGALGVPVGDAGIAVDRATLAVDDGVFAAGACVRPTRMAVRAVADGNLAACSVSRHLGVVPAVTLDRRLDSRMVKLSEAELTELQKEASGVERQAATPEQGFSEDAARKEASRCLRCDCREKEDCALRRLGDEYGARQRRYPIDERPDVSKVIFEEGTILEPGKCIKCGKCVRICAAASVADGLAFRGRGLDVKVAVPFGCDVSLVPAHWIQACIEACPTGALARMDGTKGVA